MKIEKPIMLKIEESIDLEEYIILDVRNQTEFFHGHIQGAKNIPFDMLDDWSKLIVEWGRPIIVCADWDCTSRRAYEKLQAKGVNAIDGGNWITLEKKLNKNSN